MDGRVNTISIVCLGGDGQEGVFDEGFELQQRMGMVVDDGRDADGTSKSVKLRGCRRRASTNPGCVHLERLVAGRPSVCEDGCR